MRKSRFFSHVPEDAGGGGQLKAIHAAEHMDLAREKFRQVVTNSGTAAYKGCRSRRDKRYETLAYYAFSDEHSRRIRTNNPVEHFLRDIWRRTRVVGALPEWHSALNLAVARLRHVAGSERPTKRYLSMDLLKDIRRRVQSLPEPGSVAAQPK